MIRGHVKSGREVAGERLARPLQSGQPCWRRNAAVVAVDSVWLTEDRVPRTARYECGRPRQSSPLCRALRATPSYGRAPHSYFRRPSYGWLLILRLFGPWFALPVLLGRSPTPLRRDRVPCNPVRSGQSSSNHQTTIPRPTNPLDFGVKVFATPRRVEFRCGPPRAHLRSFPSNSCPRRQPWQIPSHSSTSASRII